MTEPTRCPLCSAPHEACGPASTVSRPVDQLITDNGRTADMATDSEPRWVNMATRDGRNNWALLNIRRGDPQWEGSLPKSARQARTGKPVVRELVTPAKTKQRRPAAASDVKTKTDPAE